MPRFPLARMSFMGKFRELGDLCLEILGVGFRV